VRITARFPAWWHDARACVNGVFDPLADGVVLAVGAVQVDLMQDTGAVPGLGDDLGGRAAGVQRQRQGGVPQIIGTAGQRGGGQVRAERGLAGGVPGAAIDQDGREGAAPRSTGSRKTQPAPAGCARGSSSPATSHQVKPSMVAAALSRRASRLSRGGLGPVSPSAVCIRYVRCARSRRAKQAHPIQTRWGHGPFLAEAPR
jgi:hypothetical protein